MYYWGRSINGPWYNKTLELINFYLTNSELNRNTFPSTQLYFDVIQMRVLQLINSHFFTGHCGLHDAWMEHYHDLANSGKIDFFGLAAGSIRYINSAIESELAIVEQDEDIDANVPVTVESSP